MKKYLNKIVFLLQHVDGVWSIPLAFAAFYFTGLLLGYFFGYGTGTYDPGFIQPIFLASGVVIAATNAAVAGMWFTFRGMYRYIYGEKEKYSNGKRINYSKQNWLQLTSWQRFVIVLFVFFYFVTAVLLVYLKLV